MCIKKYIIANSNPYPNPNPLRNKESGGNRKRLQKLRNNALSPLTQTQQVCMLILTYYMFIITCLV